MAKFRTGKNWYKLDKRYKQEHIDTSWTSISVFFESYSSERLKSLFWEHTASIFLFGGIGYGFLVYIDLFNPLWGFLPSVFFAYNAFSIRKELKKRQVSEEEEK